MNNTDKQKLWGEFKQWMRFFPLAFTAFGTIFFLLVYGMALAYDPIIRSHPDYDKTIIISGIYIAGWTGFNMLFFFEAIKYSKKTNKELWVMAYRYVRRILLMPLSMYGATFLFAWCMDSAKIHHAEDWTLMIGVYIWFYMFFKFSRMIMGKNEKDK